MGQENNQPVPVPTGIKLHKKSRYLEIIYPEGDVFKLPCEYLRLFSPTAEEKISRSKVSHAKARHDVNISAINPVGSYALQIVFDDGRETGIYSWSRLYDMAMNLKKDWEDRSPSLTDVTKNKEAKRTITIFYLSVLAKRLGLENETITLAEDIATIDDLIPWLMTRRGEWKRALAGTLKITMNHRFVRMTDLISDGDEVALELVAKKCVRKN